MKITGIKKAVGEYQRANAGGYYSPHYGNLMLDRGTGEVWTDTFCSIGHNEYKVYHDPMIIDLVAWVLEMGIVEPPALVNMANVRTWAEKAMAEVEA